MFGKRKKKKATRIDTMIGQHAELQGDLHFSGGLLVDGTVKGNVMAQNDGTSMLALGETGTVEGDVLVPYLIVNGAIVGDVHSYEQVELSPKSRISGDVHYSLLEMHVGAEVNGKLIRRSGDEGFLGEHDQDRQDAAPEGAEKGGHERV